MFSDKEDVLLAESATETEILEIDEGWIMPGTKTDIDVVITIGATIIAESLQDKVLDLKTISGVMVMPMISLGTLCKLLQFWSTLMYEKWKSQKTH